MAFGKEHPYDHDVRLPFYIRGPGIPANQTALYATTHLDTTATIVELAGLTPIGPPLDGKSFAAALGANPPDPESWRSFSFSEFFGNDDTWWKIRRPFAGSAPEAQTNWHYWCDDVAEVGCALRDICFERPTGGW